jgi:hypothetical protein
MSGLYSERELSLLSSEELKKYKCRICNSIIFHAASYCSNPNHIFCQKCVLSFSDNYERCPDPTCNDLYNPKNHKEFDNEIGMITMKCDGGGCNWTGPLKDYHNHYYNCKYISLCYKCSKYFPTNIYKSHCDTCKPPVLIRCRYCDISVQRNETMAHEKDPIHSLQKSIYDKNKEIERLKARIEKLEQKSNS